MSSKRLSLKSKFNFKLKISNMAKMPRCNKKFINWLNENISLKRLATIRT